MGLLRSPLRQVSGKRQCPLHNVAERQPARCNIMSKAVLTDDVRQSDMTRSEGTAHCIDVKCCGVKSSLVIVVVRSEAEIAMPE